MTATSFADHLDRDARLTMLKALAEQIDDRLNEVSLVRALDAFGYRRSREYVRTQLRKMAEVGAVKLVEAGTVMVAEITRDGRQHLERRIILDGIARPQEI